MAEVRWTPQAAGDLESIAEFIARDSPHYARLFVMDALDMTERLESFPSSGRMVPEANNSGVRELVFGNYRIIYRVRQGTAEILTIHHGARLLDPDRLK